MKYNYKLIFKKLAEIHPDVQIHLIDSLGKSFRVSKGSGIVILLHSGMPPKMKCIVLAHEIGHWFKIENKPVRLQKPCSEIQANQNAQKILEFVGMNIQPQKLSHLYQHLIKTAGSYLSIAKAILGQFGRRMSR